MTKTLILLAGVALLAVGAIAFFMNTGWIRWANDTINVGSHTLAYGMILYPILLLAAGSMVAGVLLLIGAIKMD